VVCSEPENDAEWVWSVIERRFAKYGRTLYPSTLTMTQPPIDTLLPHFRCYDLAWPARASSTGTAKTSRKNYANFLRGTYVVRGRRQGSSIDQ
jgi:hypothetical protein